MTEPAKDEAELVQRMSHAIWQSCDEGVTMDSIAEEALAAIRAAGWAVVPVEPTEEIEVAILNATFRMEMIADEEAVTIYKAAIKAAAPGVKP